MLKTFKSFNKLLFQSNTLAKYSFGGAAPRVDSNDSTSNFLASVNATIKGIAGANHVEEFNPQLTSEEKASLKRFLVFRYDPQDPQDKPKYMSYYIDINKMLPMYLDALFYIKNYVDPTLAFRRSCREGICGSCSMNCDGLHTLACVRAFDRDLTQPSVISPLGHMFVLRDLIVDMTNFYMQYRSISPYLKRKTPKENERSEYYQSTEDRALLDGLYECVLCACCSTACPGYWWHPDNYLGPAILQQAYRWIVDSRDEYTEERILQIAEDVKLDDCQQIGKCTVTCPKSLNPQLSLEHLMTMVKQIKAKRSEEELL